MLHMLLLLYVPFSLWIVRGTYSCIVIRSSNYLDDLVNHTIQSMQRNFPAVEVAECTWSIYGKVAGSQENIFEKSLQKIIVMTRVRKLEVSNVWTSRPLKSAHKHEPNKFRLRGCDPSWKFEIVPSGIILHSTLKLDSEALRLWLKRRRSSGLQSNLVLFRLLDTNGRLIISPWMILWLILWTRI